jgi:lauroyl/myristoyl acyltransferase
LHWKFIFYELLLPLLRLLGPARCDAVLCFLGLVPAWLWPGHKTRLIRALKSAREALDLDESIESLWPELAAGTARFLARDFTLDGGSNRAACDRVDVDGFHQLHSAIRNGKGVILVGSHLGAYIAGLHWLLRGGLPVRALVQRPSHVSSALSRLFDQNRGPWPQADFFLRRGMPQTDSIKLLVRARSALRSGLALYFCGDIPWGGPNSRLGRLLGVEQPYLAIWTELAALTGVPVFHVFCTHLPGGRFRLEIDGVGPIRSGEQADALADFLGQLDARIANDPAQAVAHLLWPCFHPQAGNDHASSQFPAPSSARPSRRKAAASR